MALKRETITRLLALCSMMCMLMTITFGTYLFTIFGEWFQDINPDSSSAPWPLVGLCATYLLLLVTNEAQELVERILLYRRIGETPLCVALERTKGR